MNILKMNKHDIANGPGVRVSIWVSGCDLHCKGCFNEESWDFNAGKKMTRIDIAEILNACMPEEIRGLTILGGEPLHNNNIIAVYDLVYAFREAFGDSKDVIIYTGFITKQLMECPRMPICQYVDLFVTGPFIEDQKDISLIFKGSKNQQFVYIAHGKDYGDWSCLISDDFDLNLFNQTTKYVC